jgi:hypothetical protein
VELKVAVTAEARAQRKQSPKAMVKYVRRL